MLILVLVIASFHLMAYARAASSTWIVCCRCCCEMLGVKTNFGPFSSAVSAASGTLISPMIVTLSEVVLGTGMVFVEMSVVVLDGKVRWGMGGDE